MEPLVSVIMPVRNGGDYLQSAVDSILGQTEQRIELLLVDDHSEDKAIADLECDDPRLLILDSEGRGVSSAFNSGMAQARGSVIARMDADDIALPERIEAQLSYLSQHPGVDICGACVEIFTEGEVQGGNRRYQEWLNSCRDSDVIQRELFIESPIPNPTALFRREALQRLGGYHDPEWPEDYDLYLRADALGMKMGKPPEILLHWREHADSLTRSDPRYGLEKFQAAKAHYLAHGRLAEVGPILIWGAGPTGRLTHDLLLEEGGEMLGFLEIHPRRIGGTKRGLPVWSFEDLDQHPDTFVLVAVGAAGAREKIRKFMQNRNRQEGIDHLFVA